MTEFEKDRLTRYVEDAGCWLGVVDEMLRYPETANQAAASALARAARDLIDGIRQQLALDGERS